MKIETAPEKRGRGRPKASTEPRIPVLLRVPKSLLKRCDQIRKVPRAVYILDAIKRAIGQ